MILFTDRRCTWPSVTALTVLLTASSVVMATRAVQSPSFSDLHRTFIFCSCVSVAVFRGCKNVYDKNKLDGSRWAAVDGYASACCDLDL